MRAVQKEIVVLSDRRVVVNTAVETMVCALVVKAAVRKDPWCAHCRTEALGVAHFQGFVKVLFTLHAMYIRIDTMAQYVAIPIIL